MPAACASHDPVPVSQPVPAVPVPPVSVQPAETDDGFCAGLVSLVEDWHASFAPLRQDVLGPGRWRARPFAPEFAACVVDGSASLTASYACEATGPGHPAEARARFRQTEALVDRCLAEPLWYPRRWAKAPAMTLSGGEWQQLWRDQQAWPRPALQLKLEQDYARPGRWVVRFTGYTMR